MTSVGSAPFPDDDTIPFGEEDQIESGKLPHPYVTFFHLFFRGMAVVTYLFCGWLIKSFITSFVFVILLLSADFWTVKNITGRLLVGLRWWNYIDDEEGKSHWVYESRKGRVNAQEQRIFWLALVLFPMIWGLFFMFALIGFKLEWMVLISIAIMLNGANLYGYIKCNYGSSTNLNSAATDFVRKQVFRNAFDFMSKPAQPPTTHSTGIV
ncbi:uncharacterized Golgi apparatus membrane protein-like protein CG5021 isoform X2 [Contarinia nasturtii]|uniref:uncharacterized Golgi apparatus membrane protein-like protein CG5021 isoform X2 n=1 Tax=Contarinia nasturtii TaxID=265458 RepID=UPI0012D3FD63|nr:uncharacterized Golgi apparatus membrane protein-like protein CG5021 isoform X2 [Contarinia nasturtii]